MDLKDYWLISNKCSRIFKLCDITIQEQNGSWSTIYHLYPYRVCKPISKWLNDIHNVNAILQKELLDKNP